jgi:UDP-GlcNAc:undecaprenyl-phosphate GlcNAc-1-phosphate transferase
MELAYKGATLITLAIPIIAMGVPVADTTLSILRRLVKGNGIFNADKEHIHHKLLFREGSQRHAVMTIYFLTFSFGLIAVALSRMKGVWAFLAIIITGHNRIHTYF